MVVTQQQISLSTTTLPLKTRVALFFIDSVNKASRRSDGTVNRRLLRFLKFPGLTTPPNPNGRRRVRTSDVIVDPSRNLWFRLFVPTNIIINSTDQYPVPVIVFFHGGGFVYLAPDFKSYDHVCRRFAREVHAVVVSVNYRLAPENRYPSQYDDGFDVLGFLDDHAHLLPPNADLSRCFLAGDSAGGNIAHHVAIRACQSTFNTNLKVVGLVSIQAFFGGEERTKSEIELDGVDPIVSIAATDWMWKAFIPPGSRMDLDHEVINVTGPNAADISKLDDFPPTLVVVAGFDPLKDRQRAYYDWLKSSGKEAYLLEYPNMIHAFYVFPELPESGHLISSTKHFIHNQCSKLVH